MGTTRTAPLALLLALAACTPTESGPAAAPSGPSVPPPGTTAPATDAVRECGTWTVAQGGELPARAAGCLLDAVRDRRPARLVVTRPTVEGDPITTSFVAGSDGRVEVTEDGRLDRFGSRRIERRTCTAVTLDHGWPVGAPCSPPRSG
ncbi:DUF4362 domain-containing protein [Micromonospora sp. CPCC 205711]|uniref:DUF4362 domain-containing protein n=1 Tax=Micromonospora sp. CPCC 205547 TaxID=3122400 RepID=UPI002FF292E4